MARPGVQEDVVLCMCMPDFQNNLCSNPLLYRNASLLVLKRRSASELMGNVLLTSDGRSLFI